MPTSSNRSLFLQVSGDVSNLQASMKAGRSAILTLADTAGDVQREVQQALANISTDPGALKQIEASYRATFDNIRRNAQQALSSNDNQTALGIINASGAQQQAAAATAQASQLRLAADAAASVAERQGEAGAAARVLAAALEVQAIDAAKVASALRTQADVLAEVAVEARLAGASEDELGGSHTRMGASGLIAEHVIRSFSDSVAAGQSPVRALTLEMGRISEALTLFAAQSNATEGAVARFANFMGGPYGLAISVATAILLPLVAGLVETDDKLGEVTQGLRDNATQAETSRKAQDLFARSVDGVTAAINDELAVQSKAIEAERTAAENAEINARAQLAKANAIRTATRAQLEQALAQANVDRINAGAPGERGDGAAIRLSVSDNQVAGLQALLAQNDRSVSEAQKGHNNALVDLASEVGKRDPVARINKIFDDLELAARNAARRNPALTPGLTNRIRGLEDQRKEQVDAEREREKTPRTRTPRTRFDHSAEHAANDDRAYQAQLGQAQDRVSRATLALADTAEGRYRVEADQLIAAERQKNLEIDDQLKAGKINAAEAAKLKALNEEVTGLQLLSAARDRDSAIATRAFEVSQAQLDAQIALDQIDEQLATTRQARLNLELKLLRESEQKDVAAQQRIIDDPKSTKDQVDTATAAIGNIRAQANGNAKVIEQQNADPFTRFKQQLHADTDDMSEAFDKVKADGLQSVEDGLIGLVSGTESVKQAFSRMAESIIADLARIAIEKALVSVFGFKDGAIAAPGHATGLIPGFASGIIHGPGTGTSDSILGYMDGVGAIRVSNGESIITAQATRANAPWLRAMNAGLKLPAFATGFIGDGVAVPTSYPALPQAATLRQANDNRPLHFDLRGAVLTAELLEQMQAFAAQSGGTAYVESVKHTNRSIAGLSRPTL